MRISDGGVDTMRTHNGMGIAPRGVAFCVVLVFLFGTLVGSLAPESGNVLANMWELWCHTFNPCFLALGVAGIVLACAIGYKSRG